MSALVERMLPQDIEEGETPYHHQTRLMLQQEYAGAAEEDFTEVEMNMVLKKVKIGRAPGPDLIPPDLLKKMAPELKAELLQLFNNCWRQGRFPKEWKEAKLFILNKGGDKDRTQCGSYRPISLLPVIGKLYERLICTRLNRELEANHTLSPNQYGFRAGRNTTQAVQRVTNFVNVSSKKHVIMICLDIAGAFDGLWWPELLKRFRLANVGQNTYQAISMYLQDRKAYIRYGEDVVNRNITKGCPQGSVLGPTLWNMAYDSLLRKQYPEGVSIIAFADDTVVLVEGDTVQQLTDKFTASMHSIESWAEKVKLSFSVQKTQAMVLKGPITNRRYPTLKIYRESIKFTEQLTYLGILLDRKLTFLPHIKKLAVKTKTLFQKLKQTAQLRHGVKPQIVKTIYRAVYEPIMTYGAEAWIHRINNVHLKRNLRTSQRQVLLSITGAYRTTSFLALTVVMNATPIDLRLKELHEVRRLNKNLRQGTQGQIKAEVIQEWQQEWSEAQVGRGPNKSPLMSER